MGLLPLRAGSGDQLHAKQMPLGIKIGRCWVWLGVSRDHRFQRLSTNPQYPAIQHFVSSPSIAEALTIRSVICWTVMFGFPFIKVFSVTWYLLEQSPATIRTKKLFESLMISTWSLLPLLISFSHISRKEINGQTGQENHFIWFLCNWLVIRSLLGFEWNFRA